MLDISYVYFGNAFELLSVISSHKAREQIEHNLIEAIFIHKHI